MSVNIWHFNKINAKEWQISNVADKDSAGWNGGHVKKVDYILLISRGHKIQTHFSEPFAISFVKITKLGIYFAWINQ